MIFHVRVLGLPGSSDFLGAHTVSRGTHNEQTRMGYGVQLFI